MHACTFVHFVLFVERVLRDGGSCDCGDGHQGDLSRQGRASAHCQSSTEKQEKRNEQQM